MVEASLESCAGAQSPEGGDGGGGGYEAVFLEAMASSRPDIILCKVDIIQTMRCAGRMAVTAFTCVGQPQFK